MSFGLSERNRVNNLFSVVSDLSKNRVSEVPKEVCGYASMEKLNCYHNVIKTIPDAIVQLQALTYLNLRYISVLQI